MSLMKTGRWALIGILLGIGAGFLWSRPAPLMPGFDTREASGLKAKFRPRLAHHAQKPNQSLSARIENLEDLPDDPAKETRLRITVTANRALDGEVDLVLRLPADVRLVSGLDTRERLEVQPGAEWSRVFTLRGLSNEKPSVIKAELAARIDGVPIGGEGFFSSHPLQADLSRKPLPRRKTEGFLRKAAADKPASPPRLPAGIQF